MTTEYIGRPVSRVDGRQKVTGRATYAAEFDIANQAHAAVVRSTIANGCKRCATLTRYLRASDRVRFEWPLAQTQRAHIHDILDSRELPVRHTTRRTGRPFTLMLEKTAAVFECDAADRFLPPGTFSAFLQSLVQGLQLPTTLVDFTTQGLHLRSIQRTIEHDQRGTREHQRPSAGCDKPRLPAAARYRAGASAGVSVRYPYLRKAKQFGELSAELRVCQVPPRSWEQ